MPANRHLQTHARQSIDDGDPGHPGTVGDKSHRDAGSMQAEQRLAGTRHGVATDIEHAFQIDQNTVDHLFLAGSGRKRVEAETNGGRSYRPPSFQ